jgi:hypothetical protein
VATTLRVDIGGNAQRGLRDLAEQAAETAGQMRPLASATTEADTELDKQAQIVEALRLQHDNLVKSMAQTVEQSKLVGAEQASQKVAYEQTGSVVNNLITTAGGLTLAYWKMQSATKAFGMAQGWLAKQGGAKVALAGIGATAKAAAPRLLLLAGGAAATGGALFALYGVYKAGAGVLGAFDAGLKQSAKATDEQKKKFQELKDEAKRSGESLEETAKRMGVSLKDLDVHTTNLITTIGKGGMQVVEGFVTPFTGAFRRISEQFSEVEGSWPKAVKTLTEGFSSSFKQLGQDTKSFAADLMSPFEDGLSMAIGLRDEWLQNDGVLMQLAGTVKDYVSEGFGNFGKTLKESGKWFVESRDAAAGNIAVFMEWADSAESVSEELRKIREARQASNKVDDFQNASKDDYQRLRDVFAAADKEREKQAEKEKTRAIETEAQVEEQLTILRRAAAEKALIDQLTVEEAEKLAAKVQILEARRVEIITEARKAEQEATRKAAEESKRIEEKRLKEIEERVKKEQELQQKLYDLAREERQASQMGGMQNTHSVEMKRLEATGTTREHLHRKRLDQIHEEMDLLESQADTEEQRIKAQSQRERAVSKANTDFQIEQIAREVEATKKAEEEKLRAADELKRRREEMLKAQGIDGNGLLGGVDPREVRKRLQDQAAAGAAGKFQEQNAGKFDLQDPKQFRDYERKMKAEQNKARSQAARQFAQGKTAPEDLARAQQDAAKDMLQALADSGQINQETVNTLLEFAKAAAQERELVSKINADLLQLKKVAGALQNGAKNDMGKGKAGGLS